MQGKKEWPCFFTESDTTGEKEIEEFFTEIEVLDLARFENIGIIKNTEPNSGNQILKFKNSIAEMKKTGCWSKTEIIELFQQTLPNFRHNEVGKNLDEKM